MQTNKQETNKPQTTLVYVAPDVEAIDIYLTQNILSGSFELPGVGEGGDAW